MIKPSIKQTNFTVFQFMDKNSDIVDDLSKATVIICLSDKDGSYMPFAKKTLGNKVKIGDKFIETISIGENTI